MTTVALRTATPTITLPDPALTPLEREILDTHPVELMTRATDAENECEHGNLPFDRHPDCECWTRARTAALLGQAPLDDGCPGLDRAAALDLPIPQIEVPRQGADLQPALDDPDVAAAIHAWYLGDERTLGLAAERFALTRKQLRELFAAHDLPMKDAKRGWQARSRHIFGRADHQQEERMDSTNGAAPVTEPTTQEMHDWYMSEDERTLSHVCEHFNLGRSTVVRRFEAEGLSAKPRGGRRGAAAPTAPAVLQQPDPETPIEGIAAAIVALERERDAAAVRGLRCEAAIETLRELAA